jgi:hypothetical protein
MMATVQELQRDPTRETHADYKATLECGHTISVTMTEFYDLLIEMQDEAPVRACPECGA